VEKLKAQKTIHSKLSGSSWMRCIYNKNNKSNEIQPLADSHNPCSAEEISATLSPQSLPPIYSRRMQSAISSSRYFCLVSQAYQFTFAPLEGCISFQNWD